MAQFGNDQTKTPPCTLTRNQKQDEAVQLMLNHTKVKKMIKRFTLIMVIVPLFAILSSCNKQQPDINASIDEITQNVKFLNLNENPKFKECGDEKNSKAIIRIRLWKKNGNTCDGWGVCEVHILCWQIYKNITEENSGPSRDIATPIISEGNEDYLYLYLSEDASSIPTESLALQLEESKIDYDEYGTIIIPDDVYSFNPELGQYGGYRIKVTIIKN